LLKGVLLCCCGWGNDCKKIRMEIEHLGWAKKDHSPTATTTWPMLHHSCFGNHFNGTIWSLHSCFVNDRKLLEQAEPGQLDNHSMTLGMALEIIDPLTNECGRLMKLRVGGGAIGRPAVLLTLPAVNRSASRCQYLRIFHLLPTLIISQIRRKIFSTTNCLHQHIP